MRKSDIKTLMNKIVQEYSRLTENQKVMESNKDIFLPTITPENILFHIVNIILHPYREDETIKDNYWTNHSEHLSMLKISYETQENFCCISVASNNCDEQKKIWVFQRYLKNNNYDYGIFIKEYNWYLIKEDKIISELNFNNDVNISDFEKFICWDNKQ